jgi:hypothetical protein
LTYIALGKGSKVLNKIEKKKKKSGWENYFLINQLHNVDYSASQPVLEALEAWNSNLYPLWSPRP